MSEKLEDYYIIKDGKQLRYGYTTGSCATSAAKAACQMLLSGEEVREIMLKTPFGIKLSLEVLEISRNEDSVTCAIQKDAGDDPDVTNGALVYATVSKIKEKQIYIDGGIGVGRVTRKGLEQPIGNAAINSTPRATITAEIKDVCSKYRYDEGISVIIEIPKGVELAQKTFNPRLGIKDGISVLGTSGIVVPMSEEALLKTIEVEMKMRILNGDKYILATPGNYGQRFVKEHMTLPFEKNIICSNYIGKTIDMAINNGAKGILFISHIGKFIKVAGGIMDTHSKSADCRAELIAASAIRAGADLEVVRQVLDSVTTDESLEILDKNGLLASTMDIIVQRIDMYLSHRSSDKITIGAIVFSNVLGHLGQTKNTKQLIEFLNEEKI